MKPGRAGCHEGKYGPHTDDMHTPRTQYARSGGVNIAYQVLGDGPVDLVYSIGWISNIDIIWEEPSYADFLQRLASFSRLIVFDKRGTGLSDRVSIDALPTMEERMDDVRAVMDAAGSSRAALMGISEGGTLVTLFAATYPERTEALIVIGGYASGRRAMEQVGARTEEEWDRMLTWLEKHWGDDAARDTLRDRAPSRFNDEAFRAWWARNLRLSASPAAAAAITRMNRDIDVRPALEAIRAPTLIVHASGDRAIRADNGRYLAREIKGARYIELDSIDHLPWATQRDADAVVAAIQELVTGTAAPAADGKRQLATILYTDIVSSTEQAAAAGDRRWREVMEAHDAFARGEVQRARGRLVKTLGDGILATFDGPGRAVRCAASLREQARAAGIELRAGLHTGECEIIGDDIGGIAASIGARVSALAGPGEILVSSTVKDLVAGSGIEFADRGAHQLKGVPGEWRIYEVTHA